MDTGSVSRRRPLDVIIVANAWRGAPRATSNVVALDNGRIDSTTAAATGYSGAASLGILGRGRCKGRSAGRRSTWILRRS